MTRSSVILSCGLSLAVLACENAIDVSTSGAQHSLRTIRTPTELVVATILDQHDIVGRAVEFDSARVQAVGTAAVTVGPTLERAVLVVPVDPRMVSGLSPGAHAQVAGTVKRMPPPSWAMHGPLVQRVHGAGARIYIEADRLQVPLNQQPSS